MVLLKKDCIPQTNHSISNIPTIWYRLQPAKTIQRSKNINSAVNSISLSVRAGGCRSVRSHANVNSKNVPGSIHNIDFHFFCYNQKQKQPQPLIYAVTSIKILRRFHNLIIYHNEVMGLIQTRLIKPLWKNIYDVRKII